MTRYVKQVIFQIFISNILVNQFKPKPNVVQKQKNVLLFYPYTINIPIIPWIKNFDFFFN
jgi:hypothetical protein